MSTQEDPTPIDTPLPEEEPPTPTPEPLSEEEHQEETTTEEERMAWATETVERENAEAQYPEGD